MLDQQAGRAALPNQGGIIVAKSMLCNLLMQATHARLSKCGFDYESIMGMIVRNIF